MGPFIEVWPGYQLAPAPIMATTIPPRRSIVATGKPLSAAKRRRAKLRKELWPNVTDDMIWSRENFKGFTSIPRTMSLIITIIDSLSTKNSGSVYFGIWCRSFDDFILEVRDEYDLAFSSGYTGHRAVRSWRERVSILEQNGFVKISKSPIGSYRYILVLDPHKTIDNLYGRSAIKKDYYDALQLTLINIGAKKD